MNLCKFCMFKNDMLTTDSIIKVIDFLEQASAGAI